METLRRLARHNAWANRRVFEACQRLDPVVLGAEAKGTLGTIEATLKHLVGVEDAYLAMLRDQQIEAVLLPHERYAAQEMAWFSRRCDELAEAYRQLLEEAGEPFLSATLKVPWFETPITKRDGVIQAFGHSAQHRAQVLSTLGERGVDVPAVDYVLMLQKDVA